MKGIIGNLSSGKTTLAVANVIEDIKQRKCISNIRLQHIDYEYQSNMDFLEWYLKIVSLPEDQMLLEIKNKFFNKIWLIDEIGKIVPSRKITWINDVYTDFLTMLGKIDCEVIWTSQLYTSQVDKIYRELSYEIFECQRIDELFKPILGEERILGQKIWIKVRYTKKENPPIMVEFYIDPTEYFKYFDTREITFMDIKRLNQLKKQFNK